MEKFAETFKNKVAELDGIRCADDIIVYCAGEYPKTESADICMIETNAVFHNDPMADYFLGNVAQVKVKVAGVFRKRIVRVNLDDMYDMYSGRGWDAVLDEIKADIRHVAAS